MMSLRYSDPDDNVIVYILNSAYEPEYLLDTYTSFIWTERYNEGSDFELYVPIGTNYIEHVKLGTYITHELTDQVGIVESIETTTGEDDEGEHVTITGRLLESVLDRRVVWKYTAVSGTPQNVIKQLLNENVISPSDSARRIPSFVFTETGVGNTGKIEAQYLGDNIYDVIQAICTERDIGWKVLPNGTGGFEFKLFQGVDRSYSQATNPYVVFSDKYDNLISSRMYSGNTNYKTVMRVSTEISETTTDESGESVTIERTLYTEATASGGAGSGLARRETYIGSSVQNRDDDGNELEESVLLANMKEEAAENLVEYTYDRFFEADADMFTQFVYGEDFVLGDVIQVSDALEYEYRVRLTEVVFCWDVNGFTTTPSFNILDN